MKRIILIAFILIVMVEAAGCAPLLSPEEDGNEEPAGFLWGLWHGGILTIAIIANIFVDVGIYQIPHTRGYMIGFLIGGFLSYCILLVKIMVFLRTMGIIQTDD